MQSKVRIVFFLSLLPIGVCAQQLDSQPAQDFASVAASFNGQAPALAFKSEKIRVNYLSTGVSLTGSFSDNALLSTTAPISDFSYLVQPYLSLALATPRIDWYLTLGAGLLVDQKLSGRNLLDKNFGLDLTYRLSEHVNLQLSDTFTDRTGLYAGPATVTSGSGSIGTQQLNNSLIVPPFQRVQTNISVAELRYQFSPGSVVGVSGTYSFLDYPGSANNIQFGPLYDSQVYSAQAFYDYQMSPKQSVGIALEGQVFEIQPSVSKTEVGGLLLNYTIKPATNVTFSLFAGPEYFDNRQTSATIGPNGLLPEKEWTAAEGATFNWQGGHTSFAASFARQLGAGGGLSSGVTLERVNAFLRRQLGIRQELTGGFLYSLNNPLASTQSIRGFVGVVEFQEHLTKSLGITLGYARDHQELFNTQGAADANQAWISLSYDFVHSFGR